MSLLTLLPARYAKAIATLIYALIAYITAYGPVWHLQPALIAIGGILGVGAIPNSTPAPASPAPIPVYVQAPEPPK